MVLMREIQELQSYRQARSHKGHQEEAGMTEDWRMPYQTQTDFYGCHVLKALGVCGCPSCSRQLAWSMKYTPNTTRNDRRVAVLATREKHSG